MFDWLWRVLGNGATWTLERYRRDPIIAGLDAPGLPLPSPEPRIPGVDPGAVPLEPSAGFVYVYPHGNPAKVPGRFMPVDWAGERPPEQRALTKRDIEDLADAHRIPLCHLRALLHVESVGSGFLLMEPAPARPKILLEAHRVYVNSGSTPISKHRPDLSARTWAQGRRHYRGGSAEWDRLRDVMAFHEYAGLLSCSWGLGQVLGENWRAAGCESIEQFVVENFEGERQQLQHVLSFCEAHDLLSHLRAGRWAQFARGYNGKSYARHGYHTRLAAAAARCR